jgi:hypothetical protein
MDVVKQLKEIVSKHKIKLVNLKSNLANSDLESWTDIEIEKVGYAIHILAPILSDLNRLLAEMENKEKNPFKNAIVLCVPVAGGNVGIFDGTNFVKDESSIEESNDRSGLSGLPYRMCIVLDEKPRIGDWSINVTSQYEHMELCKIDNQTELERYVDNPNHNCKKAFIIGYKDSPTIHRLDVDMILEKCNKTNKLSVPILVKYEPYIHNPETDLEYKSTDTIYQEDCETRERLYTDIYDNLYIIVE